MVVSAMGIPISSSRLTDMLNNARKQADGMNVERKIDVPGDDDSRLTVECDAPATFAARNERGCLQ